MSVTTRLLTVVTLGVGALGTASLPVAAESSSATCGGVVFLDRDADGTRLETLEHDQRADDVEAGVAGVSLTVVDRQGVSRGATTRSDGTWSVDVPSGAYPIRIEFELPEGHAAGRPGPGGGHVVQFADAPSGCDGHPTGGLGIYPIDGFCASRPDLAVPCYVTARTEHLDDAPAIRVISNAAADDTLESSASIDDWLTPRSTVLATVGEVGTVYGQAAATDGTLYAAAFTKRHTRLTTELNPIGNPTVIYRIPAGGAPEVFVTLDPVASDPHVPTEAANDGGVGADLDAMDAVFTTGIGDIELSPDGSTLYAVDLGRRELVEVDTASGRIERRRRLDGAALGRQDCAVSDTNRYGDLRAFGLGWRDDELLIGVVCSAESTVRTGRAVNEEAPLGSGAGDADQLVGYVYGLRYGSFVERLAWPLAGDRGETHATDLVSNDASWHPWVPAYPFDAEHRAVSYPQPAITDLLVDESGDLVVALGDRWSHQTAPDTEAPAYDGATRHITESVAAGDLQRACVRGSRWVIEGSDGCEGGVGNGWEFFDGDSYGWQAETALGSVARLPGRDEIVATHMNPVVADHAWSAGGLVWHLLDDGDRVHGVRVLDGRVDRPGSTFGTASGLGDLAVLCGGPPPSLGGAVWHDRDADGIRDPGDGPVVGAAIELIDADGEVVSVDVSDEQGNYSFDNGNVTGGIEPGARYVLALADRNARAGLGVLTGTGPFTGLVPTVADVGDRDDLDSDATPGGAAGRSSLAFIEVVAADPTADPAATSIERGHDFGLRDRYDLAVVSTAGDAMDEAGIVAFRIEVRNEGSVPSGAFSVRADLPAATSLRLTGATPTRPSSISTESVTWSFGDDESIPPGGTRAIDMELVVTDPTVPTIEHRVEIVADSGVDEDSDPEHRRGEDDEDRLAVDLYGISGAIWVDFLDADTEQDERPAEGVVVQILAADGSPVGATTTDASGRFLFDSFPAGSYRVAIPAGEFESGRPLAHYDRAVGADSANVARMLRRDGAVVSDPIELGRPGGDRSVSVDLGLVRQPPTPLVDILVPAVLVPLSLLCVGFLFLDRRRHLGGVREAMGRG
jgi:SdrD B-like domain/Carboxypeptidase regulatory-like domain